MNREQECLNSIAAAKFLGVPFSEWVMTTQGKIGLELVDWDATALLAVFVDTKPQRLH